MESVRGNLLVAGPALLDSNFARSVVLIADHDEDAGLLVFDSIGFLLGDVDPDVAQRLRRARVFAGYAGWGPGQLEAELEEEGGWIVEPALPVDPFTDEPENLWSHVLRRKGGQYAILATMPPDPSLN